MRQALSLVLLLFTLSCLGQDFQYRQTIDSLCSPSFGGRGYVDQGAPKAAQYIGAQFKKIGLKPLTKKYQQYFSFPVQTFPGSCSFLLDKDTLVPGKDFIVDPASSAVQANQFKLVFCNAAKLYQGVNNFKPCPANHILVVQAFGFGGDTNKVLQTRLLELKQFAPTIELIEKKLTWSVSQKASAYPAFKILSSAISLDAKEAFIDLDAQFYSKFQTSNVVGFLKAKKNAKHKPFIVLTAHYDHLGKMGQDTYFPGANDNASGVGMLLYIANELSNYRNPEFNYAFIAFGGEEAGLVGSNYFVAHPLIELNSIRFLLNTDIMGSGEQGITVVNATLFNEEFELLNKINKDGNFVSEIKSRGPAANSDHYYFTQAGVPSFFIYTMGPNKHYHDIDDCSSQLSYAAFEPLAQLFLRFLSSF